MEDEFPHIQSDGVCWTRSEVSGFLLTEMVYSQKLEVPSHWHDRANFCIAIQGGCTELCGRRTREYEPLTFNFLPAGESHLLSIPQTGVRALCVEVAPALLERLREYSLDVDQPIHSGRGALSWLMMRLYHEFRRMDEASPLAIEGLALELLAEASRGGVRVKDRKPPRWLERAREILHQRFAERFYLEALSKEVGVHPVHLAREFRRHYRCTVGDYIRKLRIEHACREIAASDTTMLEVALKAGFSDQSHFIRVFKQHTGMTPAEYRVEFRTR